MPDQLTIEAIEPNNGGRPLVATWGYMHDEPTLALFVGDDDTPILLPRSYLEQCLTAERG